MPRAPQAPNMAQISYWKEVKKLYSYYEYNKEKDEIKNEDDLIKHSIFEFVEDHYFYITKEEIYEELMALKKALNITIDEAMIELGKRWYDEDNENN